MITSKIRFLENLCRTCMNKYKPELSTSTVAQNAVHLISIHQDYKEKDLDVIKIMELLQEACPQLTIDIDDDLPKKICNNCLNMLVKIQLFQKNSLKIEQQFREMIEEYCDPLQEVGPLSENSIQEGEVTDVSLQSTINANNPAKRFFTLIEKNGKIIEVFNGAEKFNMTSVGNNGRFNKNKHRITTTTHDTDKQIDVSFWTLFKDGFHNTNLLHRGQTEKEREDETKEIENSLKEGTLSTDVDKLFEPISKKTSVTDCNGSTSDTEEEFEFQLTQHVSHVSEGVQHSSLKQNCEAEIEDANVKSKVQEASKHLIRRKIKTSPENEYICTICGARLKTRITFRRHLRVHEKCTVKTKVKPKCQFCNKVFTKASTMRLHMRTHTGERPYLCSICGKSFTNLAAFRDHTTRHGTDFNYQCSLCPKKFQSASGVSAHKAQVHTTHRPYVCDVCGASFKIPYGLKIHKVTHGEKKNKCDYCEMKFAQVDQCRRHMRTHTGEKPYKCRYCERAFAQSNDMIKHLRFHVGENVYRCELCPRAFRLLCELRPHFASHKDDDEETKLKNMLALREEEKRIQTKIESEKVNVKPS